MWKGQLLRVRSWRLLNSSELKLALKAVTSQLQYSTYWPHLDGGSGIRCAGNDTEDIRKAAAALPSRSIAIRLAVLSLEKLVSLCRSCKSYHLVSLGEALWHRPHHKV